MSDDKKIGKWWVVASPTKNHIMIYKCSVCGEPQIQPTPFCPNCGADMRKKDGE